MPLTPQNLNAILGASVFGIFCAATLYVVEQFRQDRRKHGFERDLAKLNSEFVVLKKELEELMKQQSEKNSKSKRRSSGGRRRNDTVTSSSTTAEYMSSLEIDSSDLEYYDLSDVEATDGNAALDLDIALKDIDEKLDAGSMSEIEFCLTKLQELSSDHPDSPHLLWRIAKGHYKLTERSTDKEFLLDRYNKGIDICKRALEMSPELGDVHKWLAILIGRRSDYQPMKEKILDGQLFKMHVDRAIALKPGDFSLHHMLGRFAFELAGLKWYEKKIASALFAEVPSATYQEALDNFLEAEKLSRKQWQENKMMIAKCKIQLGDVEQAVGWLEEAAAVSPENGLLDDKAAVEIQELLAKYKR